MDANLYDYVMQQLAATRGDWREISEGAGVAYGTLTKIAQGVVTNPGVKTVQRLADFFKARGAVPAGAAAEVRAQEPVTADPQCAACGADAKAA